MLQANYQRGTKDSDVLETKDLSRRVRDSLLRLAGQRTTLATKHRMYLEFVPNGLPFLPQVPRFHEMTALNEALAHFTIAALDVVDVVVSKIMRFNSDDRNDIDAMIGLELVSHEQLIHRFHSAVDWYSMDARVAELPKYVENLHRVERDMLLVDETDIQLPGWI